MNETREAVFHITYDNQHTTKWLIEANAVIEPQGLPPYQKVSIYGWKIDREDNLIDQHGRLRGKIVVTTAPDYSSIIELRITPRWELTFRVNTSGRALQINDKRDNHAVWWMSGIDWNYEIEGEILSAVRSSGIDFDNIGHSLWDN